MVPSSAHWRSCMCPPPQEKKKPIASQHSLSSRDNRRLAMPEGCRRASTQLGTSICTFKVGTGGALLKPFKMTSSMLLVHVSEQTIRIRLHEGGMRDPPRLGGPTGLKFTNSMNASSHYHAPTAKPVMLVDVAGSITFAIVSPDSLTCVKYAQCESVPVLVFPDKNRGLWSPPAKPFPFWRHLCLSSVPVVTFIWAKAGEIDSHWFMLPNWTDRDR